MKALDKYDDFEGVNEFFNNAIKLHGCDQYEDYICAVISTDQVDAHGDCLSIEALKKAEFFINENGLSLNAHHDPRIPPLGKALAAKLIPNNRGDKNYLFGVFATYKQNFYRSLPAAPKDSLHEIREDDFLHGFAKVEFSDAELNADLIIEALSFAPNIVSRAPIRAIRKAAEPITILSFVVPGIIIYPFVQSYMSALGKGAAEKQSQFFTWIIDRLSKKIKRRILYKFNSPYRGCSVDFVVETDKPAELQKAIHKIGTGGTKAKGLIDHLINENPISLVYVFDIEAEDWIPSYIKTNSGEIYTDKPYLMSAEQFGGVSIGARLE